MIPSFARYPHRVPGQPAENQKASARVVLRHALISAGPSLFSAKGEARRDQLAAYVEDLKGQVVKFEEQRDRMLAREAQKREARAG
ncbi:Probable acyl-[acyl-carrier protein] desaturase [Mycobacteroides abscessus]|nr:Probable acyl-[acyl-carrier protein] desaturase [Mycobacteroides abscessus]